MHLYLSHHKGIYWTHRQMSTYWCDDMSLAQPGRKQGRATEDWFSYILLIIIIGGILLLFIPITRQASNEISTPSNKIHREAGRAKDLSAPLYARPQHRLAVTEQKFTVSLILWHSQNEIWEELFSHLFDIVPSLGTRLNEHDIELFCFAFSLLSWHLSLVRQICLVTN